MDTYKTEMAPRFRNELADRALRLRELLHQEAHAMDPADPHEVADFKDAAAQESIACIDNAQAAHAAIELVQVQAALRRIADGTYGECADCGDPIDLRRLAALPATPYCPSCQAVHERR